MRIGILSDTHDQVARTTVAVRLLIAHKAEVLIHCGDLCNSDVVYECGLLPSYYVFGNNDFDTDDLRRAILDVGGTCLEWGARSSWTSVASPSATATCREKPGVSQPKIPTTFCSGTPTIRRTNAMARDLVGSIRALFIVQRFGPWRFSTSRPTTCSFSTSPTVPGSKNVLRSSQTSEPSAWRAAVKNGKAGGLIRYGEHCGRGL